MELSPIVLLTYNRPDCLRRTIEALKKNILADSSNLFIYSDGPKNDDDKILVNKVREYISGINGFKKVEIINREKNYGLARSVITGVDEVINQYKKVIVLEDDLLTSSNFLTFVNQSLNKYMHCPKVFSVTGYTYGLKIPVGYNYDNYFFSRCESLGWGTWYDRWEKADWEIKDFDNFLKDKKEMNEFLRSGSDLINMLVNQRRGRVDSWAVRWCYAHFKNRAYCSYPVISKINHIGETGTHVKSELKWLHSPIDVSGTISFNFSNDINPNLNIEKQIQKIFNQGFFVRTFKRIKRLFK